MNTSNRVKEIQNVRTQLLPFGEVRRGSSFNAYNCMKAYSFNGERYGYYGYDASGERTYKYDMYSAGSWTNETGGMNVSLQIDKMMLYPNGYLNMNQNGEYTKHYYADALRIASKIGSGFEESLCDEVSIINNDYPGYLDDRITVQYEEMKEELTELVVDGEVVEEITPLEYPNLCDVTGGGNESELFFYHPDHLGNTGMVTDMNTIVVQGLLYAPFGEIITDDQPQFHNTPMPNYAFNAKELDEENGMYYYGARYYAPPTFISRDPMFEKYPSISPYAYCANNPMKFVDPTGEDIDISAIYAADKVKTEKLIASLSKITGLNLKTETNNGVTLLKYEGAANEKGTSATARDMLINAIDNKEVVQVFSVTGGSQADMSNIGLDFSEIESFMGGVKGGLNPETMGYGMTFLHELDHTKLGVNKTGHSTAEKTQFGIIGPTLKTMNTIRSELGADYGERYSYRPQNINDGYQYIPFSHTSERMLRIHKMQPISNDKHIRF
jgi:RHS repeat-associated protein